MVEIDSARLFAAIECCIFRSGLSGSHDSEMDLEEIGISAGNWVDSAQDSNYWSALVNAVLNLWIP